MEVFPELKMDEWYFLKNDEAFDSEPVFMTNLHFTQKMCS